MGRGRPWGAQLANGGCGRGLITCQTAPIGDVACSHAGPGAAANDIELAYETFGDASVPPVVLIMGLATQMIAWPGTELWRQVWPGAVFSSFGSTTGMWADRPLAESAAAAPGSASLRRAGRRRTGSATWPADVVGLIDGLGLGEVNLVEASMGGFIAQAVSAGSTPIGFAGSR